MKITEKNRLSEEAWRKKGRKNLSKYLYEILSRDLYGMTLPEKYEKISKKTKKNLQIKKIVVYLCC